MFPVLPNVCKKCVMMFLYSQNISTFLKYKHDAREMVFITLSDYPAQSSIAKLGKTYDKILAMHLILR